MGQVSRKSNPSPPSVKFKCILADYIKPRSTWIKGVFFGKKKKKKNLYHHPRPKTEDTNPIISRLPSIEYTQISFGINTMFVIFPIIGI